MPGYIIHLAVGKTYSQNNKIEDIESFERGIIEPDMLKNKVESHYGPYSSEPGLNKYIKTNGISSSYNEGYFLHLVTDFLFYSKFLKTWNKTIYEDYDKLNYTIMQRYGIIIPEKIREKVKFSNGKPTILEEEDLYRFINSVGKINIREMVLQKGSSFEEKIADIKSLDRES